MQNAANQVCRNGQITSLFIRYVITNGNFIIFLGASGVAERGGTFMGAAL